MDSTQLGSPAAEAAQAARDLDHSRARDLPSLLSQRAALQPDSLAYAHIRDDLTLAGQLTYRQLEERALSLAGRIAKSTNPGDRVLLVYAPGLEFVCAFWACMYAGVVAVPTPTTESIAALARLRPLVADARSTLILTTSRMRDMVATQAPTEAQAWRWLSSEDDTDPVGIGSRASSLAYLQYTSGSTSAPRGVMVSHANVLANVDAVSQVLQLDQDSRALSWLPHFHDYGLVYGIILPVYKGCTAYLMTPTAFVRRPLRWLEAIDRFRITHSGAPNFAYAACVQALATQTGWSADLGSMRYTSCGAEPINPATVTRFLDTFAPFGFARSAFAPAYGLAEATLAVTGNRYGTQASFLTLSAESLGKGFVAAIGPGAQNARTLVSCGVPLPGTELAIVDPSSGQIFAADRVGEILVASASVSGGYWEKTEATQATFGTTLGNRRELPFLRTGDLGFLHDGELFVTGRLKDLVILHGRNHYPQDIEWTVEHADRALRVGHCAAFCIDGSDSEQLVIVQELRRDAEQADLDAVVGSIRKAVADHHELPIHSIVLIRAGSIPRTTSGKIRRQSCKQQFLAGQLDALRTSSSAESAESHSAPTLTPDELRRLPTHASRVARLEQFIREWVGRRTHQDARAVPLTASPIEAGLDSMSAFRLLNDLEAAVGVALPPVTVLEAPSLQALSERAVQALADEAVTASSLGDTGVNAFSANPQTGRVPTSALQKGVWVAATLAGANAMYNLQQGVRIRGPLHAAALEQALQTVVDRHPSLRTSFETEDGTPYQIVHPSVRLPMRVVDLRDTSPGGREQALGSLMEECGREAFDLTRAPLVRVVLFRLADAEHVLMLAIHHLVFDGWSQTVLAREIRTLYTDFSSNKPASLPAPKASYPDYVHWESQRLHGTANRVHLDYWRTRLANLNPTELPTDRVRTSGTTLRGDVERFSIPPELVAGLKSLARAENSTLFMVLLAAFQTLLMRYSGREDICVGSPVAGRLQPQFQDTIGFFSNTLVMRTDLSGDPTFRALLARTRATALEAYEHQEIPTDRLVAELGLQPDLSRNALYPISFALQTMPDSVQLLEGVETADIPLHSGLSKNDLWLALTESRGALTGELEYRVDLFERATIQQLATHFQTLLAAVVAAPDSSLARLPLLSDAERQRILIEWNETNRAYPLDKGMHELIAEQTRKRPDAVAVVLEQQQLTYSELDARANQLAHHLLSLGVRRDVPVGICLERSFELVVSILAVLKAGGAFMPLDPEYPRERLQLMLRDSAAPVVLTQQSLLEDLRAAASGTATIVLSVDSDGQSFADRPGSDPGVPCSPEQGAYVIYTSGSSGRPKGVLVPHRGLVNHICWTVEQLHLTSFDRVLQKTSISFDASLWEFFAPLLAGAPIILARPGEHRDMAHLARTLREQRISVLLMVPTALRALLTEPDLKDCRSLRYLISGGEALDCDLARAVYRRFPIVTLGNFYGPTEASDDATYFELHAAPEGSGTVPVGKPIANVRCHILDARLQPVPVGVAGELFVGGAGIANGYLHQPELTAQRFVMDPFRPGERLYRTGDVARYLDDGNIQFLGRADFQVKVRGVRVELGEIEAALNAAPGVRQCVVVARDEGAGKRLYAYVTGESLDVTALYQALRSRLPVYLIPAAIVPLAVLPQLPNGKIDRNRLPVPGSDAALLRYVAPRGELEEQLAAIWQDVLELRRVGAEDNFFELGGHSLLATQVVSRIRTTLNADVPLRSLFESPTVAGLARHVADARARAPHVAEPPIDAVPRGQPLAVSFSQRRMWFVQQFEPAGTAYNMPFATRLKGTLDRKAFDRAMEFIVHRHEGFRTTFAVANGEPVQVIAPPAPLHVVEFDLRHLPKERRETEAKRIFREESMRPFNLASGPLFRFLIAQLEADDHAMLLLVHHAVGDQWSAGVIVRELAKLYSAFARGKPAPLAPLPIQYADFAVWQRRHLGGDALNEQLSYWREKLRGVAPLALPTDKPRPPRQTFHGSWVFESLPPATLATLKRMCAERGTTPFMALLACFKILLARYSAQKDIVVGCPVANRTRVATENLVGTLVNTLAMRTSLEGDPTFAEFLARVRETALGAFANQDLPFERLVEEVGAGRDASQSPLVQVLFNVPNAPVGTLDLDGLAVELFDFDNGSAQFDLSVNVDTEFFGRIVLTYSTDLFEPETAQRMLSQYLQLIEQVVADPAKQLSAYRLLTDAQLRQMTQDWNLTQAPYPERSRTDELIAAQALRTPQAIAVGMGARNLNYASLEAHANQLARYLRQQRVEPGARVGVCMERSVDMVVALLAVQKAGGTYVPLDPAFPKKRLEFMAEDAGLALTLTHSGLRTMLLDLPGPKVYLDEAGREIARLSSESLGYVGSPDDLAYILYTSGSTGKPKGVEVPHRALTNFLWSMRTTPGCGPSDTLLSVTTLSFDISGLELYLPLIVGGRVELATRAEVSDPGLLVERMRACKPSIMQATPATWRMLIESGWAGDSTLTVLCGGEALSRELADRLLERCDTLWNMYGPTETTIWSTLAKVARDGPIDIGRPIANTAVYILDKALQPVPVGVAGELCIGGHGLARGYRGRADLTQERFVADPHGSEPRGKIYRTGDLARFLPDGRIVHLGRLDMQVKIRGFRIELGEIESVLARNPAVARVAVAARNDAAGMPQLVAYLIPRDGEHPTVESLRTTLQASVPSYMVPLHFVFLDSFPLTANNKVDVKSLPEPSSVAKLPGPSAPTPPVSPVEVQLTALWRQVLGNDAIGIHDNFFELGGHSLQAVELFSYIHEVFGKRLPLATLFQAPTIAQMAQVLADGAWKASQRSLIAIQPKGNSVPLFSVPGVGGDVLVFAKLAKLLGPQQPFFGLQARGLNGADKPFTSIGEAARHYVAEIRSVRPRGPYFIGGTCTGGVYAYEVAQQLVAQGEKVTLVLMEAFHPTSFVRAARPASVLWPLIFTWSKLALYAKGLASLPLNEWGGFLKSKARRAAAALFDEKPTEIHADGTFASARLMRTTLQAVAAYEAEPYPSSILNVIAGNRRVLEGSTDTRQVWTQLALAPSRTVVIPAADSGQLFVSPHVEKLADEIRRYAHNHLPPSRKTYAAADPDWSSSTAAVSE